LDGGSPSLNAISEKRIISDGAFFVGTNLSPGFLTGLGIFSGLKKASIAFNFGSIGWKSNMGTSMSFFLSSISYGLI